MQGPPPQLFLLVAYKFPMSYNPTANQGFGRAVLGTAWVPQNLPGALSPPMRAGPTCRAGASAVREFPPQDEGQPEGTEAGVQGQAGIPPLFTCLMFCAS